MGPQAVGRTSSDETDLTNDKRLTKTPKGKTRKRETRKVHLTVKGR